MPTLANIRGGSLVPDIASPVGDLVDFLLSEQEKRAKVEAERQATKQRTEELSTIFPGDSGLEGVFAQPEVDSKALSVLGQIDPQAAQEMSAVVQRGNPQEFEEVRTVANDGMKLAKQIQGAGSFATKQAMLADETARVVSQGGDTSRLVDLSNMDEAHLDLEMQKMGVVGQAMQDAVPKTTGPLNFLSDPKRAKAFAKYMAKNPEAGMALLAERGAGLARQAAAAETEREAALPRSEFGQKRRALETDLARGDITQAQAGRELDRLAAGGGVGRRVIGRPTPVRLPNGDTGLLTSFSDGTTEIIPDVTPLRTELRERGLEQGAQRVALEQPGARGERKEEEAVGAARGKVRAGDLPRGRRETERGALAVEARTQKAEFVASTIDSAIEQVGVTTAGPGGALTKGIPGSPAANLASTLDTIKANVGFAELQRMRENSKTGGALGQVSERENILLQSVWGAVSQSQSPAQLTKNLQNLKDQQRLSYERVGEAFETDFGVPYAGPDTPIPTDGDTGGAPRIRVFNQETGEFE